MVAEPESEGQSEMTQVMTAHFREGRAGQETRWAGSIRWEGEEMLWEGEGVVACRLEREDLER